MWLLMLLAVASGAPELSVNGAKLTVEPSVAEAHSLIIQADRTRLDLDQSKGWFDGGVTAKRGDLRLTADKAEVELGEGSRIRKAIAEGNVLVSQGDNRASGTKAVIEGDRLVLTGNPILETARHRMVGTELIFTVGAKTVECSACTVTILTVDEP